VVGGDASGDFGRADLADYGSVIGGGWDGFWIRRESRIE
jgi:hypothetical protein